MSPVGVPLQQASWTNLDTGAAAAVFLPGQASPSNAKASHRYPCAAGLTEPAAFYFCTAGLFKLATSPCHFSRRRAHQVGGLPRLTARRGRGRAGGGGVQHPGRAQWCSPGRGESKTLTLDLYTVRNCLLHDSSAIYLLDSSNLPQLLVTLTAVWHSTSRARLWPTSCAWRTRACTPCTTRSGRSQVRGSAVLAAVHNSSAFLSFLYVLVIFHMIPIPQRRRLAVGS